VKSGQFGGALGTLVLLIAIGVAGYYAYKYFMESEETPSCKAQLNRCIANCRKSTTEASEAQACQRKCEQDADACEQKR
jgi:hypothetical protein